MRVLSLSVRSLSLSVAALYLAAGCADSPQHSSSTRSHSTRSMHGGTSSAGGGSTTHKHFDNESFWIGDKVQGSPSIRIVLSEQKAYFYKGGKLAGAALISTGREGHATDVGSFQITELDRDHKSSEYGNYFDANDKIIQSDVDVSKDPLPPGAHFEGAGMPFFMRFNGGTGMHEGFMPGYADSHGCIRMPGWIAEEFFNAVNVGTPVTVMH